MANLVDEEVNDFSEVAFAEAPMSFECRLFKWVKVGLERDFIIGEVVQIHWGKGLAY